MWAGVAYAFAAGLMWGLMFVVPLLLPEYPAPLLACGRYLAFGLIALPLAWIDRAGIARLRRADWLEALRLAAVGNLLYYLCVASAIRRAGAPLPTLIVGTLPVVIAISAHWRARHREGALPWMHLLPPLLLIACGIVCVNQTELAALDRGDDGNRLRYAGGALLACGAVACWTWYPLRNADWLHRHPTARAQTWSTAQGLAVLPLALAGCAVLWLWPDFGGEAKAAFRMPLGPQPLRFVELAAAMGLFSTWLGSVCWNQASRRLPPALAGQLLVFETLAALAYIFLLRRQWPAPATAAGIGLLIAGVLGAVRTRPAQARS
jgi:drug/metabolite transporter (DMT)-like permease